MQEAFSRSLTTICRNIVTLVFVTFTIKNFHSSQAQGGDISPQLPPTLHIIPTPLPGTVKKEVGVSFGDSIRSSLENVWSFNRLFNLRKVILHDVNK